MMNPPTLERLAVFCLVAGVGQLAPAPSRGQSPPASTRSARKIPEGLNYANGLFRARRYELAAQEYERFLKDVPPPLGPDAAEGRFGLANARLFQGEYAKARAAFEAFLAQAPDHPNAGTAWYRVGETAYMLGDLPAARKAFETFTAGYPGHKHLDTAWPYLGDVCLGMKDLDPAKRAYGKSLEGHPEGRLADRSRFGLGRALLLQDKPDEALPYFTALATKGGREWTDRAWFQVGLTESKAGRDDEAVLAYARIEEEAPKSPLVSEGRLNRAEALVRLGKGDEAEPVLRSLIADAPQNLGAAAALALGTARLDKGDAAGALATLDDALKRFDATPNAPPLLFRSAECALKLGRADDALARFLRAAESGPRNAWAEDALLRAARLTLDKKDGPGASKLADSFLERYPDSPHRADARLVSARAALLADRPKDAIKILTDSLASDKPSPATATALTSDLAIAYGKDGQSAKSAELLEGLSKTAGAPAAADALFLVGQGHIEAGRHAEAVGALESYLDGKPDGDVADYALAHLVQARVSLGELDKAFETLAKLADKFPGSKLLDPSRLRVAEAALAAKQADRAVEPFRLASASTDPAVAPRARLGLGWALLESGKPGDAAPAFEAFLKAAPADDPLAPEAALGRARALEMAKKPEEAVAAYALVASTYPKSDQADPATLAQARLLQETGKPAEAAALSVKFLADHPGYTPKPGGPTADTLLASAGWSLIDAGNPSEADALFARVLAEFPDSPHAADARVILAESAHQAKKDDEAVKLLTPLVAAGAKTPPRLLQPALYRLGRVGAEEKDWADAAKWLDRLLTEFPDGPYRREAGLLLAEVALEANEPAKADEMLSALESGPAAPTDPEGFALAVRRRRVQSLLGLKKWDDVIRRAEAIKAEAPNDPQTSEVDYARGRALQQLARMDDARTAYQAVIEARKGGDLVARAQLMIGETYFHQENYAEATRQFLKVYINYQAPHWQAAALLETGKAYEQLAKWPDAAEMYKTLRADFPDDPLAAQALDRLEAIKPKLAGQ